MNVIAREIDEMNSVGLLTPTYGRDLEICTLLCESVDRHVRSFAKHYLLVPDSDVALFAPLASERRVVIPASTFLPDWLRPLPRVMPRIRAAFDWLPSQTRKTRGDDVTFRLRESLPER